MRMNPSNKDIKILLDAVITRIEKNEKENKRISDALIIVKDELKDINLELDTLLVEIVGDNPKIDNIEKRHLQVLTTLNSLHNREENSIDLDEEFDVDFLDTIVGES
tara:strand:+ start:670 stop:990 length:321 start_codon:yes stop_codon:yes gene_type:complete